MSAARPAARRRRALAGRRRGPAPSQAGANLLVHDLKNLAGRLEALCQNLDEHYEDPLFKRTAIYMLDQTVSSLRSLATDLRQREGRVIVKFRVDLNHLLDQALRECRTDLRGRVMLEERYSPVPPVWGDAYLLRRAFSCAIENALEAMQGKGILSIGTEVLRRGGKVRVRVEIADDGPGMDQDFLCRNFLRPFDTTKEDGLGLGAYTMRQVASLHGGTLRVVSQPGLGTRVRFHFPAEET